MHFWWLPEYPDFQIPDSRKYGNSLEIAVFDKLQHIRYFSHSVLVTEFGFSLRIFESSFSWNFQIPDSRNSGNDHFGQIAIYWVFFPRSFVHWVWCFTQNFRIFILLEFPNSRFQEISKLLFLTFGNSRRIKIWKFWVKSLTQWTKLSGKNSQYVAICQKWPFPDFLESGIWKFQQNENSNILREKPSWFLEHSVCVL